MHWLLTKALYPYVLIAATALAARAAAAATLASVSEISAGLAADELIRTQELLAAGYIARAHPATWW